MEKQDSKITEITPPKWADRFFEWYCNPYIQEEIQGDLYESFLNRVEQGAVWKAKCWYWLNVILFINKRTLSREEHFFTRLNTIDMFRNYFKIGFRNILKNKGTTLINAVGMSLAIGCCLVVFQFVNGYYLNTDDFHEHRDEIYVVQRKVQTGDELAIWNNVPQPLGKALEKDFPQIEKTVRVNFDIGFVEHKEEVFKEWVSFIDPSYFDLFDFPVKWGNPATFNDPEGIVLSENIADKYFGNANPIGETLSIRFNEDGKEFLEHFVIKGVLDKTPTNASFSDEILIPFQRQQVFRANMTDWTHLSSMTFIQTKVPETIANIQKSEQKYLDIINQANQNWDAESLFFQPFKTVSRESYKVLNSPFNTAHIIAIIMLIFIAVALLILACFNYINIALAAASTRLKEISVRKVMGGNRQQIVLQFLMENVLICVASFGVGLFLAHTFFLPWFNDLGNTSLELSYFKNIDIWWFTIALILITALGGAGYPALYISKFEPVAILKKEFKLGKKSTFRKFLIGFQLTLTIITLFSTFVFLFTGKALKQKDWGFNQSDLALVRLENKADFERFKNDIQNNPDILSIAGSDLRMGRGFRQLKVKIEGEEYDAKMVKIDEHYLKTLEIPLLDGRTFDAQKETDQQQAILVNETFRRNMHWAQAEGKEVTIGNQKYFVIGEVKDFHLEDFFHSIKPVVFQMGAQNDFRYVNIRTLPGKAEATIKALEANWKKIYPKTPFTYYFQDEVFDNYFLGFTQVNSILSAAAFMTILIAIIGIFGLAMLLLTRKMKELSIRKILGANLFDISRLINKEFFIPVLIALLLGLPASFFIMKAMMGQVSPSSNIGLLPFVLTILCILLMMLISLVRHIYMAAVSNPSRFLKEE